MQADILVQTLINGVFTGGIYALVSIGLTLIYGVMMIINFAHGEFLMLGMYVSYLAFTLLGIDPYLSIPLSAAALFATGALIQLGLVQRILNAHVLMQILLLLGVSTLLTGLVQFFLGAQPMTVLVPYSSFGFRFAGLVLNLPRMIAFLASMVIAGSLYYFLQRTKTGKAIRACSQSREAAQLMGINVKFIYMLTFGIGVAVTGVAGSLLSPSYPTTPTVGQLFSVTAFVVVVLGTMGNFIGAFFGGLIIGVAEAYGGLFLGSDVKVIVSMMVFILVLLLRPQGLFGRTKT
ncbi:MAG: branched-chain amino acid ABC transporter permease [Chloroflexi bacterium]|nr:branched-chain amino acid ABC transporter permease [Chloroflexota bacterium]